MQRSAWFPLFSLALSLAITGFGFLSPALDARADPTAAASPLPGVAYDEIARVIPPGATPPPPSAFDTDAAAIAALPPLVIPKAGQLDLSKITTLAIIPYVGAWLAKAVASAEVGKQQADLQKQKDDFAKGVAARQRTGVLVRFAFFKGWSRTELTPGFAMIDLPDQGLTTTLDYAKKTYQTVRSASGVETYTVQSGTAVLSQPTLETIPVVERLGVTPIGNLSARGSRTTGSINVPRSTFLCAIGAHRVVETEYVSDIADPNYDAINASSNAKPLVSACSAGSSTSHSEAGRLVLYRVITVDSDTPGAFSVVLERGNIRAIGEKDAALFAAPADFKESK